MTIDLAPAANEPEFGEPTLTGEWAAVLPDMLSPLQAPPWCQYAVRRDGRLVGLGGFKGPPAEDGSVEIAYLTFRFAEGAGVARETAARLLEIAGNRLVRAHTLPEDNSSTRVLEANGFVFVGETEDPEDGVIWRWERQA